MVNPFRAPHVLQRVFHPNFNSVHQKSSTLIKQPHLSVFRGEGSEIERRPQKTVNVMSVHYGKLSTERWPAIMDNPHQTKDENLDLDRLKSVWQGDELPSYVTAAIIGTLAIALKLMGKAQIQSKTFEITIEIWDNSDQKRDKSNYVKSSLACFI